MQTIHLYFNGQQLAYMFCVLWLVSFSGGLRHMSVYLMRSLMISAYSLMTWAENTDRYSVIEYAAQCLVMCSWIGFASALVTPNYLWRKTCDRG